MVEICLYFFEWLALVFVVAGGPGVYNVHLPIMLEIERQAVYRERERKKVRYMPLSMSTMLFIFL